MSGHGRPEHDCPAVQTAIIYETATADAGILIEEVYTDGTGADCATGGVALSIDNPGSSALLVADPEHAREIAAKIVEAADHAEWRREMGW